MSRLKVPVSLAVLQDLAVNGNSLVVDAATHNVGIGTTRPQHRLDVHGDLNFTNSILYRDEPLLVLETGEDAAERIVASQWFDAPNASIYYNKGPVGIGVAAPTHALDVSGDVVATGMLVSFAPDGDAPLQVASQTMVDNLNAQFLDGLPAAHFTDASSLDAGVVAVVHGGTGLATLSPGSLLVGAGTGAVALPPNLRWDGVANRLGVNTAAPSVTLDVSGDVACTALVSRAPDGTPPLTVSSATLVVNLNAQYLENGDSAFYRNASNLNAGTLPVAHGGTGATRLEGGKLLVGNGIDPPLQPDGLHWDHAQACLGINTSSPQEALDVSGSLAASGQLVSRQPTGVPPLRVTSRSHVPNLNADLLDGQEGAYYLDVSNAMGGILPVARGGTGLDALPVGKLLVGAGTSFQTSGSLHWNAAAARLGIGTDTPTSALDVRGAARVADGLTADSLDAIGAHLVLGETAATVSLGCGAGAQTINIGTTAGATTINIGASGDTVNIAGTVNHVHSTDLMVSDALITLNAGAVGSGTARDAGLQLRDASSDTAGFLKTSSTGTAWVLKAPENLYTLTTPVLSKHSVLIASSGDQTIDGSLSLHGSLRADGQIASAAADGTPPLVVASTTVVTGLNADLLDGYHAASFRDAANISTGVLAVARGGTGVTSATGSGSIVLSESPFLSGTVTGGTFSGAFAGNGSSITHLNASNVATGVLTVAHGGTGTSISTGNGSLVLSDSPMLTGLITGGTFNGTFVGGGAMLTGLNATNVSAGVLSVEHGGTGVSSLPLNEFLIGNGTTAVISAESLYWKDQRLGIGVADPAFSLDVSGSINCAGVYIDGAPWSDTIVSSQWVSQGDTIAYGDRVIVGSLTPMPLATGASLDISGALAVVSNSGCGVLRPGGDGAIIEGRRQADTVDATGDVCIAPTGGNVGIGKTAPSARLDVAGQLQCEAVLLPGGGQVRQGTGDGATITTHSLAISAPKSVGFPASDGVNRAVLNTQTGGFETLSSVTVGGQALGGVHWAGEGSLVALGDAFATLRFDGGLAIADSKSSTTATHKLTVDGASWQAGTITSESEVYAGPSAWFHARGDGGLQWDTHGGGWYMNDSTWIRALNNKGIYTGGTIQTGGSLMASTAQLTGDLEVGGAVTLGGGRAPIAYKTYVLQATGQAGTDPHAQLAIVGASAADYEAFVTDFHFMDAGVYAAWTEDQNHHLGVYLTVDASNQWVINVTFPQYLIGGGDGAYSVRTKLMFVSRALCKEL